MAEVMRLSSIGFQHGENSLHKPTELKSGQWTKLINIEPGEESASIRGGIPLRRTLEITNIDWAYPFRSTGRKKLFIGKSGVNLVQFDTSGGSSVIRKGAFPTDTVTPSAERVGDTVIVSCDYQSGADSYAVTSNGSTLVAKLANIKRPIGTVVAFESLVGRAYESLPTFPVQSCRMAAVTFIRRDDEFASVIVGGQPRTTDVWGDALAESSENLDERGFFVGQSKVVSVDPEIFLDDRAQGLVVTITGSIPSDVTHVRVWVTQLTEWLRDDSEGGALAVAAGSGLRWLKDVAVSEISGGVLRVSIEKTEGQLAGQVHLSDTLGTNEIPPARQLKYFNGLLWATGARFGDSPGRSYYSNQITGLPSRSLTQFNLSDQFIDTSIDDTETTMGIASSRGNLFFINENDVWMLRGGFPSADNPPVMVAQGLGTTFPGTICENGQNAYYLSNMGPVRISGESVELLHEFTAGDVWPKGYNGTGYFHSLDRPSRREVSAFWYKDVWYITDGSVISCLKAAPGKIDGPFHIEIAAESGIFAKHFCKFSESEAYILSGASLCEWMSTTTLRDGGGFYYTAGADSRGMRIDGRSRWKIAEAFDVLVMAKWSDVGQMLITLEGQFGRVGDLFEYQQRTINDPLQQFDIADAYREIIQQVVPAYRISSWFIAGFRKVIRGDFEVDGIQIGILPRAGAEFEYISVSDAQELPAPDQQLSIFDDRFNGGNDG